MKKVKFDNSLSLELAYAGQRMPPILILEGWLVDDHVCIQLPNLENGSDWRVSLYPWGHVLTFDFCRICEGHQQTRNRLEVHSFGEANRTLS